MCECTLRRGTPKSILIEKIINRHKTCIIYNIGTHDRYYRTSLNDFMYLPIICYVYKFNNVINRVDIRAFNVTENLLLLNPCVNGTKKKKLSIICCLSQLLMKRASHASAPFPFEANRFSFY